MAVNESLAGSNEEIDRVSAIKATKLGWNLVVGVVRLYELPNQWISKDATSIEMVLQDQNGDRIHCSIGRTHVGMFKSLFRENEIYAMRNFIVQNNSKPPRTTAHKFKLSFYVKTEAAVLRNSKIQFAPFNFFPYYDIEPMPGHVDQFLIDCIGHVVAKEDPKKMVTKAGFETVCMSLYLEDLELMAQGDVASQQITQIEEQPDHSVGDELEGGARPLNLIEEVLNMTDEGECWILGSIVSVESGVHDWCYLACNNCPKKVIEVKNGYKCKKCLRILADPLVRYKLNIIVADGTGCLNLIVWNQEGKLILGKSANEVRALQKAEGEKAQPKIFESLLEKRFLFKVEVSSRNISSIDLVYSVQKICDDETLICIYSSDASIDITGTNQTLSNPVSTVVSAEIDSDLNAAAIVSLSKDSGTESNFGDGVGTPMKDANEKEIPTAVVSPLCNPDVQGSSNKTFRRGGGKRKFE